PRRDKPGGSPNVLLSERSERFWSGCWPRGLRTGRLLDRRSGSGAGHARLLPPRTRPPESPAMRTRTLSLAAATMAALLLSLAGGPASAEAPADAARGVTPPKGFTALFNGRDLSGWHGMPDYDPRKLAAMPG